MIPTLLRTSFPPTQINSFISVLSIWVGCLFTTKAIWWIRSGQLHRYLGWKWSANLSDLASNGESGVLLVRWQLPLPGHRLVQPSGFHRHSLLPHRLQPTAKRWPRCRVTVGEFCSSRRQWKTTNKLWSEKLTRNNNNDKLLLARSSSTVTSPANTV